MEVTQKRILYVITKANWGGAQRYVFDLAVAARDQGHEVAVLSGAPGELTRRLEAAQIPVIPVPELARDIRIGSDLAAFRKLREHIRAFRPTVVHGNSSKAGGLVALASRLERVPRIIFTAHGWAFNEDRPLWQKPIIALLHYLTVLLSDETICVSNAMRRQAWFMLGARTKMQVIHNGVTPLSLLSKEEARQKLYPNAPFSFWIGTIAELHPVKQLSVLVDAMHKLASRYPDVGLVIIGEGQEREALTAQIKHLGLEDRVRLCGHVEQAAIHLSALDVFVLPSRSEGLAYVILEAGLASLPVVASRVGGIPEVITSASQGTLVHSGDAAMLAGALRRYKEDAVLRETHGKALNLRVTHDFSTLRMVERTLALYR